MLLGYALLLALRNYWRLPRPESMLSGVLFICIAGFYFLMLSVASYSWGQQGYMNWILISMSICLPRVAQARKRALTERDRPAGSKTGAARERNQYALQVLRGGYRNDHGFLPLV
jgi:hypothetical protein